ncbi:hypothetical protein BBO99_00002963 [Phytophthora kernoviae]|uniref:Uncharacterized protein n=1 Tax=Phytophthora kernoviae TaxID=325452 RepID=A0A3R7HKT9_9STRA|nr:hypothetical protein BBI17_003119 [Phytophthora kernoviae]RLN82364.1 hypothetical protein BBO99_00002963 [Phytophthora kernoviae]
MGAEWEASDAENHWRRTFCQLPFSAIYEHADKGKRSLQGLVAFFRRKAEAERGASEQLRVLLLDELGALEEPGSGVRRALLELRGFVDASCRQQLLMAQVLDEQVAEPLESLQDASESYIHTLQGEIQNANNEYEEAAAVHKKAAVRLSKATLELREAKDRQRLALHGIGVPEFELQRLASRVAKCEEEQAQAVMTRARAKTTLYNRIIARDEMTMAVSVAYQKAEEERLDQLNASLHRFLHVEKERLQVSQQMLASLETHVKSLKTKVKDQASFKALVACFNAFLDECVREVDIKAAKTAMILAETFFFPKTTQEFWEKALLLAIGEELQRTPQPCPWEDLPSGVPKHNGLPSREEAVCRVHNIVFGQLGSFTLSMLEFEVPLPQIESFVETMCDAHELAEDQRFLLRKNLQEIFVTLRPKDSEPANKRRRAAANCTTTNEKPPNRKRFLKFLKSHELKFGLEPVARDVATGDVTLVVCRFCQHFGREQRPEKKRRSTKNVKYFRSSFRTDQYQQHHELSHGQTWARYQASSDEEKPQYTEEQTAEYVRLIIAVSLNVTSRLLRECWAFSLELRASMQHAPVRSYLEFRVKVYSGGTMHNLHLLSIPGFESKCKIMMYETLDRVLSAVLPNWRQRLLGVATDGDAQMPSRVLDIIARLQQEAVNPVVHRSTSGCHQLDRIVDNFYSSLQGGCFLLLLKDLVVYIRRQPELLAKMSDQFPPLPPCTSGRYATSKEKWVALGQQTNWIAAHRELLYQHFEDEKPLNAPDNSWWLFFTAVHWVASRVNETITKMLRKNATSVDQVTAVATLAKDCAIAFHAQGPVGESLLPGDTTPNVKMYTSRKGHFALSKPNVVTFIKEVTSPSIRLIEATEEHTVDLFAENTAMCGVNMIESLVELSATLKEQNDPNADTAAGVPKVTDFLPPSLPHELIQLNGRELATLLQTYGPGVRSFLSEQDIEVMDQELQTLRRGAARETVLSAALAKCNEDVSFEEAWAPTKGRFKLLECFAGGFASVFPCTPISTIGGTADLALCRGEMDTAKVLLVDFALEGALHAQQFPALIALYDNLDIDTYMGSE